MRKLGVSTLVSVAINIILSLWLVNQYFYDQYFHAYVDSALGPVYPFIVLTAGLGGGSSLGYLLLRRRHAAAEPGRLGGKLFKSGGQTQGAGNLSSSQAKIMPTGPPPGQVSRHTAYAVPPLPKSSTTSGGGGRSASPSSVSVASKTPAISPSISQRLDQTSQSSTSVLNSTLRDQFRPEPISRPAPNPPQPFSPPRPENAQSVNRIPPEPSRTGFQAQWKNEAGSTAEKSFDSTVFPRPDLKPGVDPTGFAPPLGQPPRPPQASQTPFPVSKWTPSEQRSESQWTDPVPKPGLAAPQKWAPPPGQGFGPRPPQTGPPRPGAGPMPPPGQRPPLPPGQGPPRPLGFPAPPRPGQPGPVGVVPQYRSDQPRPGSPAPAGRPGPPLGGLPQPWSPPRSLERSDSGSLAPKDVGGAPARPPASGGSDTPRGVEGKAPESGSSGGEMDWDTALDTILKTLKKDRGVGEKT